MTGRSCRVPAAFISDTLFLKAQPRAKSLPRVRRFVTVYLSSISWRTACTNPLVLMNIQWDHLRQLIYIVTDFFRNSINPVLLVLSHDAAWFQFPLPELKRSNSGSVSQHFCHCLGHNKFLTRDAGGVKKMTETKHKDSPSLIIYTEMRPN